MATAASELDPFKFDLRAVARELGRMLVKPPVILYFVLGLTIHYWIGPAMYVLLRTFLLTPNGLIVWALAVGGAITFFGGFSWFLGRTLTHPVLKAMRACRKAGDRDGYVRHRDVWKVQAHRLLSFVWASMLSAFVLIPTMSAIIIGGDSPMLIRENGKPRFATHEEQIRMTLRTIERRGIFTPWD